MDGKGSISDGVGGEGLTTSRTALEPTQPHMQLIPSAVRAVKSASMPSIYPHETLCYTTLRECFFIEKAVLRGHLN